MLIFIKVNRKQNKTFLYIHNIITKYQYYYEILKNVNDYSEIISKI